VISLFGRLAAWRVNWVWGWGGGGWGSHGCVAWLFLWHGECIGGCAGLGLAGGLGGSLEWSGLRFLTGLLRQGFQAATASPQAQGELQGFPGGGSQAVLGLLSWACRLALHRVGDLTVDLGLFRFWRENLREVLVGYLAGLGFRSCREAWQV
jgi:hypothetical protein